MRSYEDICYENGEYKIRRDVLATVSWGGDEYYTTREIAEVFVNLLGIEPCRVWCPFDTEDSEIVKCLREKGFDVVATHIWNGQDFFEMTPPDGVKAVISNPPFSKKRKVVERIVGFGLKFALILPILWLNDGLPFDYGEQIAMFRKRVKFIVPETGKPSHPRTNCFVLSNGILRSNFTIIRL